MITVAMVKVVIRVMVFIVALAGTGVVLAQQPGEPPKDPAGKKVDPSAKTAGPQGPQVRPGLDGDVGLLQKVSQLNRANRQAINTWQGTAKVETTNVNEDAGKRTTVTTTSKVTFAQDLTQAATRWNWTDETWVEDRSGTITKKENLYSSGMKRKGFRYAYNDQVTIIPATPLIALANPYVNELDPSYFLTSSGTDVCQSMDWLAAPPAPNARALIPTSIKQEGDLVIIATPAPHGLFSMTFDLSKAGNLVSEYNGGAGSIERKDYTFKKIGDLWVLSGVEFDHKTQPGHRVADFKRSIHFTDNRINEPLADDAFSLKAMGVPPGVYVHDNSAKIRYKSESPESLDIPLPGDSPLPPARQPAR